MSYGVTDSENYKDIADAIRYLNNSNESYSPSDMADAIRNAKQEGSGLTDAVKQALLQIASKVAYTDAHGQDYYDALYDALYAVTAIRLNTNAITLTTLGATSQLTAVTVPEGGRVEWTSSNPAVATVSANGLVTSVGYGSAVITATSGNVSATCAVAVEQLVAVSLDAVYTQSGRVLDTDSLDTLKADLVVTVGWSDGTSTVVPSADCVLSGTLAIGTSTVTVVYARLTDTFSVAVDGLVSIFATYTQSGEVYNTDSLDSLKADLVVTGVYNSGSSAPITDYTLSGTLAVGTSTITVTYLSFTDDFDVVVSVSDVLYKLPQATTFNGTSDYIDTGVALHESDIDYTIMLDFEQAVSPGTNRVIFHCMHEESPYNGVDIDFKNATTSRIVYKSTAKSVGGITYPYTERLVVTHVAESGVYNIYRYSSKNGYETSQINYTFVSITENAILGAYQTTDGTKGRFFNGTINRCEVYSSVKSQSAIEHFLGMDAPVQSLAVTYTSGNPVVEGMDLNWLKVNMTVTATLTNGIVFTPANYTLSGTLTEGTSHVTATYKGVSSDPITVTVGAQGPLYQLPQATTFDGVDDYIDTEVDLPIDASWTMCIDADWIGSTQVYGGRLLEVSGNDSGGVFYILTYNNGNSFEYRGNNAGGNYGVLDKWRSNGKVIISHEYGTSITKIHFLNGTMALTNIEAGFENFSNCPNIILGANGNKNGSFYNGTINDFAIYGTAWSQTEIESYLAPIVYPDTTPALLYELSEVTTFDGTKDSAILVTNANVMEYDQNYTFMVDAVSTSTGHYVFGIGRARLADLNRFIFWLGDDMALDAYPGYKNVTKFLASGTSGKRVKCVITHTKTQNFVNVAYKFDGESKVTTLSKEGTFAPINCNLQLGGEWDRNDNCMTGTIYDFKVYRGLVSQTDIDAYLA